MKRKIRLLFLVLFSLLFLVGFGKKSVELLSDKKLIDLNAAIAYCLPGADSATQEEGKTPLEPSVTPRPSATPRPTVIPTIKPQPRTVIISVRERVITYNSGEKIKLIMLEDRIRKDSRYVAGFQLVDDYAEAHVYREIIGILEKLEEELGISYTRD